MAGRLMFLFEAVKRAGKDLQLQEVELFSGMELVDVVAAANPYGRSVNGQYATRSIDGNKVDRWSKWLDVNHNVRGNSTLVLELASSAELVDRYDLWTANDLPHRRDPITWKVYREAAGGWELVDRQVNVLPPLARFASYGGFLLSSPPPPMLPVF